MAAVVTGALVLFFTQGSFRKPPLWAGVLIILIVVAVSVASRYYTLIFERLIFGTRPEASEPFAHVVENRYAVTAVTKEGAVFGGGVYDGNFNVDPINDVNYVVRPYSLSAFVAAPKRIFVIGLASGSWAQILANHPQLESMDVVEINPGHLKLIPQYPEVRSLLANPKVHIHIDDARRWLVAHPAERYDAIVSNSTFYWRDHNSYLASTEYMELVRAHLNRGGVYCYNTTESDDAMATGLKVFPYALRILNLLAVSDSPITVDKQRWMTILRTYKIDGVPVFNEANPQSARTISAYMGLADTLNDNRPRFLGMESSESLRSRLRNRLIFTDDNMGWEWRSESVQIPWH
jgi:hypothetical protein